MTRVSEEIRKQNYLWTRKRDSWRSKYKTVSTRIRELKDDARFYNTNPEDFGEYKIMTNHELSLLRKMARELMIERETITLYLRETSYRWV